LRAGEPAPAGIAADRRTANTQPISTQTLKMNHWIVYDRCGPSSSAGGEIGSSDAASAGVASSCSMYIGSTGSSNCWRNTSMSTRRISVNRSDPMSDC